MRSVSGAVDPLNWQSFASSAAFAPPTRQQTAGRLVAALLATIAIGCTLRSVARAGVNQAIDNHYGRRLTALSTPTTGSNHPIETSAEAAETAIETE